MGPATVQAPCLHSWDPMRFTLWASVRIHVPLDPGQIQGRVPGPGYHVQSAPVCKEQSWHPAPLPDISSAKPGCYQSACLGSHGSQLGPARAPKIILGTSQDRGPEQKLGTIWNCELFASPGQRFSLVWLCPCPKTSSAPGWIPGWRPQANQVALESHGREARLLACKQQCSGNQGSGMTVWAHTPKQLVSSGSGSGVHHGKVV